MYSIWKTKSIFKLVDQSFSCSTTQMCMRIKWSCISKNEKIVYTNIKTQKVSSHFLSHFSLWQALAWWHWSWRNFVPSFLRYLPGVWTYPSHSCGPNPSLQLIYPRKVPHFFHLIKNTKYVVSLDSKKNILWIPVKLDKKRIQYL